MVKMNHLITISLILTLFLTAIITTICCYIFIKPDLSYEVTTASSMNDTTPSPPSTTSEATIRDTTLESGGTETIRVTGPLIENVFTNSTTTTARSTTLYSRNSTVPPVLNSTDSSTLRNITTGVQPISTILPETSTIVDSTVRTELYISSTETQSTVSNDLNPDSAARKASEAEIAFVNKDFNTAYNKFAEVYNFSRIHYGPNHYFTLAVGSKIGYALTNLWKLKEAEKMLADVLDKQKMYIGTNHKNTLRTEFYQAANLINQGNFPEAHKILVSVLDRQDLILGVTHWQSLETRTLIGALLIKQRKYQQAHNVLNYVDDIYFQVERLDETWMRAYSLLGYSEAGLGLVEIGTEKVIQSLQVAVNLFPNKNHSSYLDALKIHADLLSQQKKYGEAETKYSEILKKQVELLGRKHGSTLETLVSYVSVLIKDNKFEVACEMMSEYLNHFKNPEDFQDNNVIILGQIKSLC